MIGLKGKRTKGRTLFKSRNVRPVDMDKVLAEDDYHKSWTGYYMTSSGNVISIHEWEGCDDYYDDEDDEDYDECDESKLIGGVYYDIATKDGSDGGVMDYTATDTLRDFNEFQRDQSGGDIVGIIEFPNDEVESEFEVVFDDATCNADGYERLQAFAKKHALYNRRPRV